MRDFIIALLSALALVFAFFYWVLGYHIVWPPTDEQMYGCPAQQQNGECR